MSEGERERERAEKERKKERMQTVRWRVKLCRDPNQESFCNVLH